MASYGVKLRDSALKELGRLSREDARRVTERLARLAVDPRPFGCVKLAGGDTYRVRQGDSRIVYTISRNGVRILLIE